MDKPDKPCRHCGSNEWWLREGEWLCEICHPKPNKEQVED
jgi:hypothetical protein